MQTIRLLHKIFVRHGLKHVNVGSDTNAHRDQKQSGMKYIDSDKRDGECDP